ncbi:alpha-1,2-Mannosidase [Mycena indigotica]|uniref:alpha-1,2-Mannosidase n=1 Tax=Mycena indigotica TaxID=2126181 RepID=A0A8H6T1R3_9AGAR|nr:alpha-1,2-Mannosidase [Mycena indigotica]KAF7309441.1 alpha-1,2-Mannosidase [Mycena indigotica]
MLPFHVRDVNPPKPRLLSIQSLRLLHSRPALRWLPLLLGFILVIWLFAPFLTDYTRHSPPFTTPQIPLDSGVLSARAQSVKEAYIHAYSAYHRDAWGFDELRPVSGTTVNNFNGWSVSVVDSLDTMWIMGLYDLFEEGLKVVTKTNFYMASDGYVGFFETIIRYLGGLLSAYALSGEPILLEKADQLGSVLLPAFNTPSGLPMFAVNPTTGATRGGWTGSVLWAEALSNQMEFKYLAHLTGNAKYYQKTEKVMELMYHADITEGQFPTQWDSHTGKPTNQHFSVGAYADSAHEYLLKQWLLTGQSEPKTKELYLRVVDSIIDTLLYVTPNRKLLYVTDTNSGSPTYKFEHLSCFLPGLLTLGAHTLDLPKSTKERHQWAAEGIATTCWLSYADQATGLGPDEMTMMRSDSADDKWVTHLQEWESAGRPGGVPPGLGVTKPQSDASTRDYRADKTTYLLRPEAIESFYLLWRTTGDEAWRERGWAVFQAIEKHARLERGYASVSQVDAVPAKHMDEMPSYFLAETLKYLYLMFIEQEIIPLDKWVLNTEAHPLPIFQWDQKERKKFNIPAR